MIYRTEKEGGEHKRPGSLQYRDSEGIGIRSCSLPWAPCTLQNKKLLPVTPKIAISKSIRPSGPGMEATGWCLDEELLEISWPLCQAFLGSSHSPPLVLDGTPRKDHRDIEAS